MTRQFWYNRIYRLCKEHLVSPPEAGLEEYTITELEQWTMRRIRARCNSIANLQLRSRYVAVPDMADRRMRLIPGGRWLLVFGDDEPVYFFDLDSNNLSQDILIDPSQVDPRISNSKRGTTEKHVWIDHKAPRLSLRLGVSFCDEEEGLYFLWVHIYQVNLVGHGASATLVANVIATFRSPGQARFPRSSALDSRYFVQMQQPRSWGRKDTVEIRISDYSRAFGSLDYPLIVSHTLSVEIGLWSVELIDDNILLVLRPWSISVYTCDVESPIFTQPLHEFKFSKTLINFSRSHWTPQASLITFVECGSRNDILGNDYTIHGLVIPHDSHLHPWMVKIGDGIRGGLVDLKLGLFNSLACDRRGAFVRIAHEWDITSRDSDVLPLGNLQQRVDERQPPYLFDEDTGRLVHFYDNMMDVVDN